MKKLLVIPMLLLYLIGISGISVSSHYCCSKLTSVKITLEGAGSNHTSKTTKKSCCNDVTHFYNVNAPQEASVQAFSFETPAMQMPVLPTAIGFIMHPVTGVSKVHADIPHSPPLQTTLPLFIRNESFLI